MRLCPFGGECARIGFGRIYGEGRLVSKGGRWWRGWRRRGIHCRLGRIFPRSEALRRSFWLLAKVQVRERLVEVVAAGDCGSDSEC